MTSSMFHLTGFTLVITCELRTAANGKKMVISVLHSVFSNLAANMSQSRVEF